MSNEVTDFSSGEPSREPSLMSSSDSETTDSDEQVAWDISSGGEEEPTAFGAPDAPFVQIASTRDLQKAAKHKARAERRLERRKRKILERMDAEEAAIAARPPPREFRKAYIKREFVDKPTRFRDDLGYFRTKAHSSTFIPRWKKPLGLVDGESLASPAPFLPPPKYTDESFPDDYEPIVTSVELSDNLSEYPAPPDYTPATASELAELAARSAGTPKEESSGESVQNTG